MVRLRHPELQKLEDTKNDTTRGWRVPGYRGSIGFISSMSDHFCGSCSRLRVGADGNVKVREFWAERCFGLADGRVTGVPLWSPSFITSTPSPLISPNLGPAPAGENWKRRGKEEVCARRVKRCGGHPGARAKRTYGLHRRLTETMGSRYLIFRSRCVPRSVSCASWDWN